MFDSDNIPLVTRVEAGNGVIVDYTYNSNGEGVWKATLDSDYVLGLIHDSMAKDSDARGAFAYETRILAMENLLGISFTVPTTPVADSDLVKEIAVANLTGNTAAEIKVAWKIISFDGDPIVSKNLTIAAASNARNMLNVLMYAIKTDVSALKYLNTMNFNGTFDKLIFDFKPQYANFRIEIDHIVTSGTTRFVVSQ